MNLFGHEEHRVSGVTHGDDFVVMGAAKSAYRSQERNCWRRNSIKTRVFSYGPAENVKALNRMLH